MVGFPIWSEAGRGRKGQLVGSLEAWCDLAPVEDPRPLQCPAVGSLSSGGEGITRALGCGARSAESALIYELRLSRRRRLRG